MDLKTCDPRRRDFVCKHEADVVPPVSAKAEAMFQHGLMRAGYGTSEAQRNPVEGVRLWQQAIEMGHWKALIKLANLYIDGYTEPLEDGGKRQLQDVERGGWLGEQGMKAGFPSAFDFMDTLHNEGLGVKGDASRAWALWEVAADVGSAKAQAHIGPHLLAADSDAKELFWANEAVGIEMLERAVTRSNGKAAHELGTWLESGLVNGTHDYLRALRILHGGVKWESDECADALASAFGDGTSLVGDIPDEAREHRYTVLGRAMRFSGGDLRLPNLDKVTGPAARATAQVERRRRHPHRRRQGRHSGRPAKAKRWWSVQRARLHPAVRADACHHTIAGGRRSASAVRHIANRARADGSRLGASGHKEGTGKPWQPPSPA